jgi:hypothetical protein
MMHAISMISLKDAILEPVVRLRKAVLVSETSAADRTGVRTGVTKLSLGGG